MADRTDNHIGDELCTEMLMVVDFELQIWKNTGRKCENERSLMSKIHFRRSAVDAAAESRMNTVPIVKAGLKLQTLESIVT